MNALDLLLIAFFGGIVGLAFMGGLGKVVSALVGLYFGVVFAAFFYHPLALAVGNIFPNMALPTGDLLMFLLLLTLGTVAFAAVLARTFVMGRFPAWLGWFNNLGGGVLGVLVALLSTVLAAMVLSLSVQVLDRTATLGGSPFLVDLQQQMHTAALVPIFLKFAPTVVATIHPFSPKGLPPLLAPGSY